MRVTLAASQINGWAAITVIFVVVLLALGIGRRIATAVADPKKLPNPGRVIVLVAGGLIIAAFAIIKVKG